MPQLPTKIEGNWYNAEAGPPRIIETGPPTVTGININGLDRRLVTLWAFLLGLDEQALYSMDI